MPTVRVNEIEVNYLDSGQGDALVLVHNLISSIHGYDFNIPAFSKHFRTIAYDQRGHGLSSKPESGYTFDTMSEDLYQLLTALKLDSCYLLGTAALGIGVMLTFFMKHPEMVKALIPVSGALIPSQPTREGQRAGGDSTRATGFQRLQEVAREGGMVAVLEERKKTMTFWTDRILNNPEIWSRFELMYHQTAVAAFLALPERFTEERWQKIKDQLHRHEIPVMQLVGGEHADPMGLIRNMKSVSPRLHGVILPDAGHYPAIENPDDFNMAVLNFLAGVRAYG